MAWWSKKSSTEQSASSKLQQLQFKSHFIPSLKTYAIVTWDFSEIVKNLGVELSGLKDSPDKINQTMLMLYASIHQYEALANKLPEIEINYTTVNDVEVWAAINTDELTAALSFLTSELIGFKKKAEAEAEKKSHLTETN